MNCKQFKFPFLSDVNCRNSTKKVAQFSHFIPSAVVELETILILTTFSCTNAGAGHFTLQNTGFSPPNFVKSARSSPPTAASFMGQHTLASVSIASSQQRPALSVSALNQEAGTSRQQ